MIGPSVPIYEKYFRYVVSWLLFGVAGTLLFWQWGWVYVAICVSAAFMLSFGYDLLARFVVKQKVKAMVGDKPFLIVDAVRMRKERKGYLVFTKRFVLFVPVFQKIKTVIEADQIIRYEADRLYVEIIARFPNRYRTFPFVVLSSAKVLKALHQLTGEKMLPYKYEKLEENNS
ncbi:hypothetical protein ACERII_03815 [Evansella sp. AB-rgal1]|uniref:hypothetical protein n=1 Tax=Evansella sp. AB-rgal1 TaxID=3242696 RepID=UPI00359DC373